MSMNEIIDFVSIVPIALLGVITVILSIALIIFVGITVSLITFKYFLLSLGYVIEKFYNKPMDKFNNRKEVNGND